MFDLEYINKIINKKVEKIIGIVLSDMDMDNINAETYQEKIEKLVQLQIFEQGINGIKKERD
ncbi:hypothetical protein [Sphingobacterium cellulitidis]|uniref:Uncharacterized protein n=1 Tax=Sphingobacterium cellulitidis TaxID=1768011 RepID=A0A8H9G3D4_9SPHI|nr:hypothetical protein [Sphingobacterium soli]MBA8985949.1 hypothetical protein [Sphingobacterium soli]GGE28345.1 hypothetical protein GCM10011516_27530 [Sphingobacterium soli]